MDLTPWLEDLESRLDPAVEEPLWQAWQDFAAGRFTGALFAPRRVAAAPARIAWPAVRVNATLDDPDAMVLQQLGGCSGALASGSGALLAVRSNFGTGIMPSLFGAELFVMPEETDTLPTTRPIPGGLPAMAALVARGVPAVTAGLGARVFAWARHLQDLLRPYPKLRRYVHLYHPDLQGPMDVAELLWGSPLFLDILDEPAAVHALLDLICTTYEKVMRAWWELVPPVGQAAVHWSFLHPGRIMLRDDSAMNFSPAIFGEFIAPYDARLLTSLGGGVMHFCGRGDHYIALATACPQLYGINLSQPELNDMEVLFHHTVDRGRFILDCPRVAADAAVARGRHLHGRVHTRAV